jgi:hypothetical protein
MATRLATLLPLLTLLCLGCPGGDGPIKDDSGGSNAVDADGDGFTTDEDCDDSDPSVHPGAEEACDGIDNDCDGETDEGTDTVYYGDVDGDGYGDEGVTIEACSPPQGYVENADDCDDDNADINPGATELCNGYDDDCDTLIDDDDDSVDPTSGPTWYVDDDGDGYGVDDQTVQSCSQPDGYVDNDDDCNDARATIYPGADEYCNGLDDDCDGDIDEDTVDAETRWYPDADGDGYGDPGEVLIQCTQPTGYVLDATDCDDADASIYPDATEYCDGADNDCDGTIDENDAVDGSTWYADSDGDGYGDAGTATYACYQPTGYVADDADCDDTDASQHPGAYEWCNGEDDDCDGNIDEDDAVDVITWYADSDGDSYGDAGVTDIDCYEPTGFVLDDTDCDDTDAAQYPGADEYCNGEDDDCDGYVDEDEAVDVATWYADRDADGYGDASTSQIDCDQPTNYVADDTDCDDTDATQNPGADEYCNGEDDDCDGDIDEDDAVDVSTWFADADGDAWGDDTVMDIDCDQPSGYVPRGGDCDDTDPAYNPGARETDCTDPNDYNCDGSVAYSDNDGDGWAACEDCDDRDAAQHPGADEYCNGEDDDCDGTIDEDDALDVATWYADNDGDRYGDATITDIDCAQPSGYVADSTDCDDTDRMQHPGAVEYCNGEDDDCDGTIDEDTAFDVLTWYADNDGDSYGDPGVIDIDCDQPRGYVADDTDCDDTDASQYPGATEWCNGEDDDCDGYVDEDDAADVSTWYIDSDGDSYGNAAISQVDCDQPTGYVLDNTDCDDTDADQHPGADEWCNGEDDDCDGTIDEDDALDVATWYADTDGDSYGDAGSTDIDCDQPTGFVADDSDCDDTDASQYPGADEYCNGEDDDCDGRVDEDDALDVATWYADTDGDSYGDPADSDVDCDQPTGFVADNTDCDDTDASQYPGADEYCNGEDDDCDGDIDEDDALDVATWYADDDGDSYGDPATSDIDCDQPTGFVADDTDCDDTDPMVNPSVSEVCNGIDDDCDGDIDEDDALDVETWYADADGDSYGDAATTDIDCDQPTGYVLDDTDCDDTDAAQYPGADEYCNGEDDDCDGLVDEDEAVDVVTWYADDDGDSYGDAATSQLDCDQPTGWVTDDSDCDDTDAAQYPGATEWCNGEDDDCDGTIDEDDAADVSTWYADDDGDSYGDAADSQIDCDQPTGYVLDDTDCDDTDGSQYPGADEWCNGEDDDCDGTIDEDDAVDVATWYADSDGDRYGDAATSDIDCDQPSGFVADSTDCDDTDASQHPGATEYCNGEDDDCDGDVDEDSAADVATWYADTDGDSYGDATSTDIDCDQPTGFVADDTDCDDTDAAQHPGADEYCNGEDDDCDGLVDEPDAVDVSTWYVDADSDGYGGAGLSTEACNQPTGFVADSTDCDDSDASQHPGATEYCNGEDDDCDGDIDEDSAADVATWYADTDGDSYGDAGSTDIDCDQPTGFVADNTDCDDTDAAQYPGATEYCNNEDDDCDGTIDEDSAADVLTWYADSDSDSFGDASSTDIDCDQPTGFVADDTDCDDTDASQYPGANEWCNGEDDDCDGTIDEDDAMDASTWYADVDGDSYGNPSSTDRACSQPSGYVADSSDCDDTDAAQYPGADEYCNGEDDDCDGAVDEDAMDDSTWYADDDGDGFGDAGTSTVQCTQPPGYVLTSTDCDDTDSAVHPGATEYCNGIDDDCDGTIDEDDAFDVATWYADDDGDSYGDAADSQIDCDQPTGYVADSADCDDTDASQHPGADEYCNGEDDDCDGTVDEDDSVDVSVWYADDDGDSYGDLSSSEVDCYQPTGYVADSSDCDDTDAAQYPGATEWCNGEDDDCDGVVDEDSAADVSTWYVDADSDGYGGAGLSMDACYQPPGYVADNTDCDDSASSVHPGAAEYCNGIDDDCDGAVDGPASVDASTWYVDADSDGYGGAGLSQQACSQPTGYVADNTDCDDADASQYPGADEYCNGEDDDCDGTVDEDGEVLDGDTWYADADSDGTGDAGSTLEACSQPSGYVDNTWDCDDSDGTEPVVADASSGSSSGAGTLYSPLDTIQAAVDNATQCVIAFAGTYVEAVHLNGVNILVTGVEGADSTFIDATGLGEPAMTVDSGETAATVVTGFTLTGDGHLEVDSSSYGCTSIVTCTDWYYTYCGGGLYLDGSSASFVDLVVEGSSLPAASTTTAYPDTYYTYSYGGGICALGSSSSFDGVDVFDNDADQGGGLYADEYSALEWSQGWIDGNSASDGGGFQIEGGSIDATNLIWSSNTATADGGGVLLIGAYGALTNTTFAGGSATSGGGLYASASSTVDLMNSIIYGTSAGAGVLVGGSSVFAGSYSDVYGNTGGNYSGTTDPTGTYGNISANPLFTSWTADGVRNDDLGLQGSSPCVDTGNGATAYFDPDGSRNDMGAYGGPGASW